MIEQTMTRQQAYALLEQAAAEYDAASAIFTRMSQMATWTGEYDALQNKAYAHGATARSLSARYEAWKNADDIAARRAAILAEFQADADELADAIAHGCGED